MTRWKVDKLEEGLRWGGEEWRAVDLENAGFEHWFPTWREAMDYADRAARTVELVLPRNAHKAGEWQIGRVLNGLSAGRISIEGGYLFGPWISVHPDDVKPLALALLAHHYKQEVQP